MERKQGIELFNLIKVFPGGTKAVDDVSINFKKNEITGLIGFNGSGKTTIFNILSEIIDDYGGKFLFDGKPIDMEIRQKISYLAAGAEPRNPTKAINHLIDMGKLYGLDKKEALEIIEKYSKIMEFEKFLKKPIKSLSKGNQQKIKLIQVLMNPDMEYLFLDEPFDGLDPIMTERVKNVFMGLKDVTIIITSHRMEVVQSMCNEFYVLKKGKVIDARKTSEKTIVVEVNKEVTKDFLDKIPFVINIKNGEDHLLVTLESIDDFKKLTRRVVRNKNYKYLSLRNKNIAEAVFKGEL